MASWAALWDAVCYKVRSAVEDDAGGRVFPDRGSSERASQPASQRASQRQRSDAYMHTEWMVSNKLIKRRVEWWGCPLLPRVLMVQRARNGMEREPSDSPRHPLRAHLPAPRPISLVALLRPRPLFSCSPVSPGPRFKPFFLILFFIFFIFLNLNLTVHPFIPSSLHPCLLLPFLHLSHSAISSLSTPPLVDRIDQFYGEPSPTHTL